MPAARKRLEEEGIFSADLHQASVVCLWDTIEHIEAPEGILKRVPRGGHLLVSMPVFADLAGVRRSKHYRPGEHLYYFTNEGFVEYMALYGFRCVEQSAHERAAGRDEIGAFAFIRDLPGADDHVRLYGQMHRERFYGSSATELHLADAARVVRALNPSSVVDFGCGRSDLVAHFWRDGKRRIARFDPAIPEYQTIPEGHFDLALCCDVLEHIPMVAVDHALSLLKTMSDTAFFTISTRLARAKLPDGRNAHVTLLTRSEWMRWIADVFGEVRELPSKWEHELIIVAGQSQGVKL
jgi:2-polyprenyl-3-methyl-5-hydroxy-6-metoxy-1,4-benzoquinol methylase